MRLVLPEHRVLVILQYVLLISFLLYFGSTLFIPLSFALLVSCILYPICSWLEKHKVSRMSAIAISISVLTLLIGCILLLLVSQLVSFLQEWSVLKTKFSSSLTELSSWLTIHFNFNRSEQVEWFDKILNKSGASAVSLFSEILSIAAVGTVYFILIPIYAILILYYRHKWISVLNRIFPTEGHDRIREIVRLSIQSYYNFIKGMAVVYLIVGALNSIGLLLLGIPHAFLFGFIASILTFIPYIGILVASLLPISMAWITYNSIWYPFGVIVIFAFVQYLEANLIFPLAVSSRLKLNALVTIISIFAGGVIWGVSGMILFIPFLAILKLVADRTPSLRTLSVILGDDKG